MQPKLYSKKAIGLIALLVSPFLGCILFALNLRDTGRGRIVPMFIIGALFLAAIMRRILPGLNPVLGLAIMNIIGSSLLTFYFWDKFFGESIYEKRNPWMEVVIFIGSILLILLAAYLAKKN